MIKRKQDTVLKVAEGGQLMDFLMAKMGGMARSSVKQLLGQRRVKVGNAIQTRHDFMLKAEILSSSPELRQKLGSEAKKSVLRFSLSIFGEKLKKSFDIAKGGRKNG